MIAKAIKKDKYILSTVIISLAVAVLIHFPESVFSTVSKAIPYSQG